MKIVLLLLSSAMLAVLCYAAFRENVTEFYDYIDSIEKPFNEDKFFKRFEQEAQEINLYSKNKEDKKALKKLLKKIIPIIVIPSYSLFYMFLNIFIFKSIFSLDKKDKQSLMTAKKIENRLSKQKIRRSK